MSILSGYITYLGFGILTYKTLQSFADKQVIEQELKEEGIMSPNEREQKENKVMNIDILKRWITFIVFIFFEPFFLALAELIPFGLSIVLITKFFIIYPHVLIHLYFYQLLEKLELDNYAENKLFVYISSMLKELIIFTLDLISDAVKYVNLNELSEIEQHIQKVNNKIGFKIEVCEKRNSLLSNDKKASHGFKSAIEFRKSAF